jgi:hypothetical protein
MTISQDPTHPTGVSDTSPRGSGGAVVARDRKAKAAIAIRMRKEHDDWDTIAEVLGYPSGNACQVAVETTLRKEYQEESAEFGRRIAGEMLEDLMKSVSAKAVDEESPDHLLYLREKRILIGQWVEMFGYNAPKRSVIATPTAAQIEKWVANVQQLQTPDVEEEDIFDAEVLSDTDDDPDGDSLALPS